LPEAKASELNNLYRRVDNIRYEFDEVALSSVNRATLTKLEVKMKIAERDKAIEDELKKDSSLYQIWRLSNLNSNVIPPTILLKFNRVARQEAPTQYLNMTGKESFVNSREEKLQIKVIEVELKKASRRAYLNKIFKKECERYISSPETYIAPDFV
jgi:hypothetical protein